MDTLAEDVISIQVDAYNARDLERFLACYKPEVVIEDGVGQVLMQGHEAVRDLYSQLFAQSPTLHCEIRQRIRVGSFVVDEEAVTGFNLEGSRPRYTRLWCTAWRGSASRTCVS